MFRVNSILSLLLLPVLAGAADKPFLGISVTTPSAALRYHLQLESGQGLVVASVHPDSPAAKAGIQQHDVILEIAGKALGSERQLIDLMATLQPQQTVACWLVRKGKHDAAEIKLASRSEASTNAPDRHRNHNTLTLTLPPNGGHAVGGQSVRTMVVHDGTFAIDARQLNDKITIVVRDQDGKVLFDGPVQNADQIDQLPEPVRIQLKDHDFVPAAKK